MDQTPDTAPEVAALDVLRAALGDAQLHHLGHSYGTLLGSEYAARHPDRTGRMAGLAGGGGGTILRRLAGPVVRARARLVGGVPCVRDAVDRYLPDGSAPEVGTCCDGSS